jgi:exodeoxyribonuclease V alpha subunit
MTPEADIAPEHWLAHGFAERVARWARERGTKNEALNLLQEAAYRTSVATSSGHVCVPLGEIEWPSGVDASTARNQLLETHVVGTPVAASNLPLILDDENRLYLHRYFDYERRFAARLMHFARAPLDAVANGPLRSRLNKLFAGNAERFPGRPD